MKAMVTKEYDVTMTVRAMAKEGEGVELVTLWLDFKDTPVEEDKADNFRYKLAEFEVVLIEAARETFERQVTEELDEQYRLRDEVMEDARIHEGR